jgi:hypothetical protein
MTRLSALLLSVAAFLPWWRAESAPTTPYPTALLRRHEPAIVFVGDDGPALPRARSALERVLQTPVGVKARELLESGVLVGPLTIDLNHRGENFTAYRIPGRELGETIHFDPWSRPLVETERGREEALPETVLAHELGHAVFKLVSEEAVIQAIENPVREQMGMPRRRHF